MFENIVKNPNRQKPIRSSDEDKLNRGNFINYVINLIENAPTSNSSFVIAINGKWGEGKTSTKNLVIEGLKGKKHEKNLLLEFNSIDFQNQKEINTTFLNKITNAIKNRDSKFDIKNFYMENRRYIVSFLLITCLFTSVFFTSTFVKSITTIGSIITSFFFLFRGQLRKINLGTLMDVASRSYLKVDVVHKILYYDSSKNSENDNEYLKKYLELKCSYNEVVVFLDNFDSLEKEQIKILIKLINKNINLPKFVFVLFYDKKLVENALTNDSYTGTEYLEKLVNVQLDLPLITEDILQSFLQTEIQDKYKIDLEFSENFKYVKNYFTSLSKIFVFLDTFDLNYKIANNNLHAIKETFNKNDFLYLEILRLFENEIYRELRKMKFQLTSNLSENAYITNNLIPVQENENLIKNLLKIINNSKNSTNLLKLILKLFPYLDSNINHIYDSDYDFLFGNKSVGSVEYFDYYFMYDLSDNTISENNFRILIKDIFNHENFKKTFEILFCITNENSILYFSNNLIYKINKQINYIIEFAKLDENINKKDFVKNLLWLYIYENKDTKYRKYILNILIKFFHERNGFYELVKILESLLEERHLFFYFSVVEILKEMLDNSVNIYFKNNQEEINKSKHYLMKIIINNIYVLFSKEFLDYLSDTDNYSSILQKKYINFYIKDYYLNNTTKELENNKYLRRFFNSDLFKNFKHILFTDYIDLLLFSINMSIVHRNLAGKNFYSINMIELYPFTSSELLNLLKDEPQTKNSTLIVKILKKISKFKKKYPNLKNLNDLKNEDIVKNFFIKI